MTSAPGVTVHPPIRWPLFFLGWLWIPALAWLLIRLLLASPNQPTVTDFTFAASFALLLLVAQPLALTWFLRRVPAPSTGLSVLWLIMFSAMATGTLALFWTGRTGEGATPTAAHLDASKVLRFTWWWLCWGGCWLGVWHALATVRVPAVVAQVSIGVAATVLSVSIFWLNANLELTRTNALASADLSGAIQRTIRFSPLYAVLGGVLDHDIFRSGRMYLNSEGAPLSMIGDHLNAVPTWPKAWELGAQWAGIGLGLWGVAMVATRGPWLLRRFIRRTATTPAPPPTT